MSSKMEWDILNNLILGLIQKTIVKLTTEKSL